MNALIIKNCTPKLDHSLSALCRRLSHPRSFSGEEGERWRGGRKGVEEGGERREEGSERSKGKHTSFIIWSQDGFVYLSDIQKSLENTLNLICIVLHLLKTSV